MADLTTKYLGFDLKNPIIIGSSGLTDSVDKIKQLEEMGAGAVSLKSIFEEEIMLEYEADVEKAVMEGSYNPNKFDYYDFHIKKENLKNYFQLISDAKKAINIPVFASINCRSSYEWPYYAKEFVNAGADALELNVFILPSDIEKSQDEIEKKYFEIIESVRKEIRIPVSLKISYYFSNLAAMIKKLSETDIEGLILFNRFYSPDFDINELKVLSTHVLSSPDELPISLRWIAIMANKVGCDLVASTGIHTGEAIIKQILAGADAVQIASALYKNGVEYLPKMITELENWMDEHQFSKLRDFRGKLSHAKAEDSAMLERVQFMKYFSERDK